MIYTQEDATVFIQNMIQINQNMTLSEFTNEFRSSLYPECEFEFMNTFLDWSLTENANQFIISHEKLYEYGITSEIQTKAVKQKVDILSLQEEVDYLLTKLSEQLPSGTKYKHQYHFTPKAFKLLLMSATKHKNHTIDVSVYRRYYLFLEEVVAYYQKYQLGVSEYKLSMANQKLYESSCKIDRLEKKMDEEREEARKERELAKKRDKEQQRKIDELLGYAEKTTDTLEETKETLNEIQNDLTETKEEVKIAKSYLQEKSFTSTKNPSDEKKHHYFAATTFFDKDKNQVVKFVTGQKSYVQKTIAKNIEQSNHKSIIKPFYNANGIDLRQNVFDEFSIRRTERINEINQKNKADDKEFNSKLLKEIKAYNKLNPDNQRIYMNEKRVTPMVRTKHIPVKFSPLSFVYTINPHIGFNEVLQIIIDVNNITQDSPMNSDDGSDGGSDGGSDNISDEE